MNTVVQNPVRSVERIVRGRPTSDGAGVRLNRLIGTPTLPRIDPFLMLDEFRSDRADDYIAGFPNHPHRGFETVTYMLAGRMRHGDNHGNSGLLTAGSVQWMTAGRGIVHSEMPEQEDGLMWGFQLWVNLPAKDKMTAPRYQDIAPEKIPALDPASGVRVKLVAGELDGQHGPVNAVATEPVFMDVSLQPGASWRAPLPAGHSGFAYVFEGSAMLGADGEDVKRGELAVLKSDGPLELINASDDPARVLVVAGKPLREPVAHYGPFVMNTEAELRQAIEDFQAGRF
jgi:redox-sensitive bicupin YhaK (pirin superfamily)